MFSKSRKTCGLILLSMGVGMLIVVIFPWSGFFLSSLLIIVGFLNLFL